MIRPVVLLLAAICLLGFVLPAVGGEIHEAIQANDVARVKQILAADPGATNERDNSQFRELPIHIVAATGNVEIARLLLDAGADVDAGDSDNSTALGVAAMRRQGELVTLFIERGANVNHRDRKADCPLSFAVYGRDEAIIQQLVDAGADLWYRSPQGETLLHHACGRGLTEFVTYLLDHGAEVNALSEGAGFPIGNAAGGGFPEIVQLLITRGASVDPAQPGEWSPLIITMWRNQLECARVLLENGAAPDYLAFRGNTALFYAARQGSAELVDLLIKHGADVNHVTETGETALVSAAGLGYTGRVQSLLSAGADPNLGIDEGGRTALQLAALGGHMEVTRSLLEHGANANTSTPSGETPLQLARYYGNDEVASLLVKKSDRRDLARRVDRSLAALGDVGGKEAVIWFLGHSGWAVKTENHLMIFDYFPEGEDPASPGLCNGRVNPGEIAGQRVAVFASHFHGDHYSPDIFAWNEQAEDITYFLGLQPRETPPYEFMSERLEQTYGDIKLTTIHSTDAGVGMMIEVDGLTIFHPGDHANGQLGLMDEFTDEIDWLAARGFRPDICFMGIRGCSLGTPEQVLEGVQYTLEKLDPKVFIPMHAGAHGHTYREFIETIQPQFGSIQMVYPGNRGDHFVYKDGLIKDPKGNGTRQARAD
jgi:ankyrin repeat protein/L-ascorbate metabolism protein UlaG (beta-lactamase superfamily)